MRRVPPVHPVDVREGLLRSIDRLVCGLGSFFTFFFPNPPPKKNASAYRQSSSRPRTQTLTRNALVLYR